jgi:hypothetical protein
VDDGCGPDSIVYVTNPITRGGGSLKEPDRSNPHSKTGGSLTGSGLPTLEGKYPLEVYIRKYFRECCRIIRRRRILLVIQIRRVSSRVSRSLNPDRPPRRQFDPRVRDRRTSGHSLRPCLLPASAPTLKGFRACFFRTLRYNRSRTLTLWGVLYAPAATRKCMKYTRSLIAVHEHCGVCSTPRRPRGSA